MNTTISLSQQKDPHHFLWVLYQQQLVPFHTADISSHKSSSQKDKPFKKWTIPAPQISRSCIKIKINLYFYFNTSFWSSPLRPP